MKKLFSIFAAGLLISFLGTLPMGTLTLTAFQLAASQDIAEAALFSFAVILVELIVVYLTLYGVGKVKFSNKFFHYLTPMAILLLTYLSISNFVSAGASPLPTIDAKLFSLTKSSFLLGLLLSSLNPMHIPFWVGWNSVLISKNKLLNEPGMHFFYLTGIGLGSIGGFLLYILSGSFILKNFQQYNYVLSYVMACIYLCFAIYLTFRRYKYKTKSITLN